MINLEEDPVLPLSGEGGQVAARNRPDFTDRIDRRLRQQSQIVRLASLQAGINIELVKQQYT
jgi:hypothetical protein